MKEFVSVQTLLKALDANAVENGRYQKLYTTVHKGINTQRALSDFLVIPQTVVSAMLRRLITCGVLKKTKGKGAQAYVCVCPSKLNMERMQDAYLVLTLQKQLEDARTRFKNIYDELP